MDEKRILSKINELDSYLAELDSFIPKSLEEYENSVEKRRVSERLLQISIECVIDICSLLVKTLNLGEPSDEDDVLKKLNKKGVISNKIFETAKKMKGFRNVLVHRYAEINDELVFEFLKKNIGDFSYFKKEILSFIKE